MQNKFDIIYYANHPEEWEIRKADNHGQIELRTCLLKIIEEIILCEDNFEKICFNLLFWNSIKEMRLWHTVSHKMNHETGECSIFCDIEILIKGKFKKHEFYVEYIQGKRDCIDIRIRNFENIKNLLLSLYADLNIFIGQQTELISIMDLIILKLQGKSLNKEFLHLTDAPFLKNNEKLKDYKEIYLKQYGEIKSGNYKPEEEEYASSIPEVKNKNDFAFTILVKREKENPHFLKQFHFEGDNLDPENINSIIEFSGGFAKAYSNYKYKQDNQNQNT